MGRSEGRAFLEEGTATRMTLRQDSCVCSQERRTDSGPMSDGGRGWLQSLERVRMPGRPGLGVPGMGMDLTHRMDGR